MWVHKQAYIYDARSKLHLGYEPTKFDVSVID